MNVALTVKGHRSRRPISRSPRAGKGTFWLDMVSLFPKTPGRTASNGLRPDLAEMLGELKPAFVRFPGGCWVEGDTMKFAYRWKETIGDLSERRTQYNIWNYHATHGLGFHEYLQMCEDLGAEPLFVINCGMSHRENVPMDRMREFVQDALDAIEYCNGPADSQVGFGAGQERPPRPVPPELMEIGNENGGPAYQERYALFYDAIKKRLSRDDADRQPADDAAARRRGRRALLFHPRVLHPAGRPVRQVRPQGPEDLRGRVRRDARTAARATSGAPWARRRSWSAWSATPTSWPWPRTPRSS